MGSEVGLRPGRGPWGGEASASVPRSWAAWQVGGWASGHRGPRLRVSWARGRKEGSAVLASGPRLALVPGAGPSSLRGPAAGQAARCHGCAGPGSSSLTLRRMRNLAVVALR